MTERKKLRAAAFAIAGLLTLSLCACGGGSRSAGEEASSGEAEQLLEKAENALGAVKSLRCGLETEIAFTAGEGETSLALSGTVDAVENPLEVESDMTLTVGEAGEQHTLSYTVQEAGQYVTYTGMDDGAGSVYWMRETPADNAVPRQYDVQGRLALCLERLEEASVSETETIEGQEAVRVEGVLTGQALTELLESTDILSALGLSREETAAAAAGLSPQPVTLWISGESGLPVQWEADLTELTAELLTLVPEDCGDITVEKIAFSVTVLGADDMESIVVPEAALDAREADRGLV